MDSWGFGKNDPIAGGLLFAEKTVDVQKSEAMGKAAVIVEEPQVLCVRNHSVVEMTDCLCPMTLLNFVVVASRHQLMPMMALVLDCQQELIPP